MCFRPAAYKLGKKCLACGFVSDIFESVCPKCNSVLPVCSAASKILGDTGSPLNHPEDHKSCNEQTLLGRSTNRRSFDPFQCAADVFCSQIDPQWAQHPYWKKDIADMGCGLCSFTMAVDILTGARLTPVDVYNARREWGFPQKQEGNGDICARDAHEEFNLMLRNLFGVESSFLKDKSLESFRQVLEEGKAVIWFSSRDWGEPWIWADGAKSENQHTRGHLVCAWKYENGNFFIKDPCGTKAMGNNVIYTHDQFEKLLVGVLENRYILHACEI